MMLSFLVTYNKTFNSKSSKWPSWISWWKKRSKRFSRVWNEGLIVEWESWEQDTRERVDLNLLVDSDSDYYSVECVNWMNFAICSFKKTVNVALVSRRAKCNFCSDNIVWFMRRWSFWLNFTMFFTASWSFVHSIILLSIHVSKIRNYLQVEKSWPVVSKYCGQMKDPQYIFPVDSQTCLLLRNANNKNSESKHALFTVTEEKGLENLFLTGLTFALVILEINITLLYLFSVGLYSRNLTSHLIIL